MLFWAASEALTAVAFLLSTVRTLKALSPGRDYDGGRNQPDYDILRVWACLGLLIAAEQYLGWVLWYLPFYGVAKCIILGVAVIMPEARVAPILFGRAVVPIIERLREYLGQHSLIKNLLIKHLLDLPIFFLEEVVCIYPTDHAEDVNMKWPLAASDETETHARAAARRMDGGGVYKEKTLVVVSPAMDAMEVVVREIETHCGVTAAVSTTPSPPELVNNLSSNGSEDNGTGRNIVQNLHVGDDVQTTLRKESLRYVPRGSQTNNNRDHLLDVGTQATKRLSHSRVLRSTISRNQKVRTQEEQQLCIGSSSRRQIGEVKFKMPIPRVTKRLSSQRKKGSTGGKARSSKTKSDDMTIVGQRTTARSAVHVGANGDEEEEKFSATSLHAASKRHANTKSLTHGQHRAAKRPPELYGLGWDNKVAKLDITKRNSNNQGGGGHHSIMKELKVVKEMGKRSPLQPASN